MERSHPSDTDEMYSDSFLKSTDQEEAGLQSRACVCVYILCTELESKCGSSGLGMKT